MKQYTNNNYGLGSKAFGINFFPTIEDRSFSPAIIRGVDLSIYGVIPFVRIFWKNE